MNLAIILWIYKDVSVSVNRAEWLRRLNPGTQIFCLYGGPIENADQFETSLATLVDDFYAFREPWSSIDKWMRGDKMLAIWHAERGTKLEWDTVFVAQWDLLLLAPVRSVCGTLDSDQLLLPGLRPVADVEKFWYWTLPNDNRRQEYDAFVQYSVENGQMPVDPYCCNFLACALPRRFLDRYSKEAPDSGFLEYKLPILAQIWGFSFCTDHDLNPVWAYERRHPRLAQYLSPLHAEKTTIPSIAVAFHVVMPAARRTFHPYHRKVPIRYSALFSSRGQDFRQRAKRHGG